jgi:hypothetical protein
LLAAVVVAAPFACFKHFFPSRKNSQEVFFITRTNVDDVCCNLGVENLVLNISKNVEF